jgi:ATP-dependent Clp protease protease subunit
MLKNSFFSFLSFLSLTILSNSTYNNTNKILDFNSRNLITIRGPIQGSSSTNWITAMNDRDPDVDTIYLYLSSPGGSVLEGTKIIDQIKTLQSNGANVVCIADFAASMAFIILQSCPTRLAIPSSILMQHQMSLGLKGSLENIDNYLEYIHSINDNLEKMQADRMNMTEIDFRNKVMNDWWIPGHLAKTVNAVDDLVMVKCSKELLSKQEKLLVRTILGTVEITYSKCPIAREPVDIKFYEDYNRRIDWELIENEIKDYIPSIYLKYFYTKKDTVFYM